MLTRRILVGVFFLIVPGLTGSLAHAAEAEAKKPSDSDYELYQVFADTLDQVERNYVKDVSRRELMEAAINGVLSKLDPYSSYISPDDLSRFKTSVESQFGGIGIQITIDHDQLKVLSPLVGTPAYRAGIQAGDRIVEIDGKPTAGISLDDAVHRLKGEIGASVGLTVIHSGLVKPETLNINRELIHVETVMGDHRQEGDAWDYMLEHDKHIGYIRLTTFSRDTAQDLKKSLETLQASGIKGLILDLRFNPGGLLTSAIEVSDLFISKGRIVSTQGRNSPERVWDAQSEGTFEGFPMVVLVNRYSASASEIVAACLQDHKRAVIVGERTWGKGSVQNVIELEGGKSALKLTTASYRRPSGKNIHRFPDAKETDEWGVMPDKGFDLKLSDMELHDLVFNRRDRDILAPRPPKATKPVEGANPAGANDPAPKAVEAAPAAEPTVKTPPIEVKPEDGKDHNFVDRQLQKAVDYLTQELARGTRLNVLTLETTCDETAAAVVTDRLEVLSSVVASQDKLHEKFGGVVPEIASRAHVERVLPVINEALSRANLSLDAIDAVAVANSPGLAGSLLVGLMAAKAICLARGLPLVAVNHLQAHIYACRLAAGVDVFPCVGLIVSGGHTSLYHCRSPLEFELLGGTIDDAAGEAFDKVASLLGLPFPGGPSVERTARGGNPRAFRFPRPFLADAKRLEFSFSGLKTAVRYQIADLTAASGGPLSTQQVADLAASFQEAVVDCLVGKALLALEPRGLTTLCVGGGVAANSRLRERLESEAAATPFKLVIPPLRLCTDNAVMGAIAVERLKKGWTESLDLDVFPRPDSAVAAGAVDDGSGGAETGVSGQNPLITRN